MRIAMRYGVYLGGFLVFYGLVFRAFGLDATSPLAIVFYLALPIAIALLLHKARRAGPQSFSQGVLRGAAAIFIGAFIYGVYVYFFNAFIDDTLINSVRERALAGIDAGDHAAATKIARIDMLTTPHGFAMTIFFQLLIAGSASAFLAAPFFRRTGR